MSRGRQWNLSGLVILVVDDEPDLRDLVSQWLEMCGAEVRAVDSPIAALQIIGTLAPAVIVSEVMPDGSGNDMMRQIRAHRDPETRTIPAIAHSTRASAADRTAAIHAGFNCCLPKPLNPEELARTIISLVSGSPNSI